MGVHISKVRSVTLDKWDVEQLTVMKQIGNTYFNAVYEANVQEKMGESASEKERAKWDRAMKDAFIRAKYVEREYISPSMRHKWTQDEALQVRV